MWKTKVVAAADVAVADAADAAETNWKNKVTPHWGDLITGQDGNMNSSASAHYLVHGKIIWGKWANDPDVAQPQVQTVSYCFELKKSWKSGVTLCFQFVSAASASAAATTFASHVKTVRAKPYIFGTKNLWVWGNVLNDLSMTLT